MYFVEETTKTLNSNAYTAFRQVTDKQYHKEYKKFLKMGFLVDRFENNGLFKASNVGLTLLKFTYKGQ